MTDTEVRAYLAERWSRSQPKEAALDNMADGIWEDRREDMGRTEAAPLAKTRARRVISAQLRTTTRWLAIARHVRRTAFGWRHAQTVSTFVDGRREVLAAYDDLRERTRIEGDAVALSGAYRETLTRHAVLQKQAAAFRARPDDFASLLAERGGIGPQGPRRLRGPPCPGAAPPASGHDAARASMKKEAEQEAQQPKPELRQGELALEGGPRRAPMRADTVTRGTAGMLSLDRDAGSAQYFDTLPPSKPKITPGHMPRPRRRMCRRPGWTRIPPSRTGMRLRSIVAGLERTHRTSPANRGAVILRQGLHRHDPTYSGAGGEPGYRGRDTGADDRSIRKIPTGSLGAPIRRGLS